MPNVFHKDFTLANNHVVHAFEYADADAREGATGLMPVDIGKIARQADDGTFWILVDDVVPLWSEVGVSGSGVDRAARRVQSTGILSGGLISEASSTTIDITAGTGVVVDFADPTDPVLTEVSWEDQFGVAIDNIGTNNSTVIAFDANGDIQQVVLTDFGAVQRRDLIGVGVALHLGGAIVDIYTAPENLGYCIPTSSEDFIREVIGPANISGNVFSPNGANLSMDNSGGDLFELGINFRNNVKLPNQRTQAPAVAASFIRVYRQADPAIGMIFDAPPPGVTVINPTQWDDGSGTLQTVPEGNWTIQRIFIDHNGLILVAYGQALYSTVSAALAAMGADVFQEKSPLPWSTFRGYLVVEAAASDLSDSTEAQFHEAASFRIRGHVSPTPQPGGDDKQVQFNDDGAFGGDSGFTYSKVNGKLTLGGPLTVGEVNDLLLGADDDNNVFIGTAIPGTIGTRNTALGKDALAGINDEEADRNVALGFEAGHDITTGQTNVLVGFQAGDKITTGSQNTALGNAALGALLTGFGNVVLGHSAGPLLTGSKNVILGRAAAALLNTGAENFLLGDNSAPSLTDGDRNILLGVGQDVPAALTDDFLNIGGLLYGDLANGYLVIGGALGYPAGPETLRVEGDTFLNGDLGIGIAVPARTMHLQGSNTTIRIDRDTNSPGIQIHRFPSGDFTTPWKGFLLTVTGSESGVGTLTISDLGTAVSGGGTNRLTIDNDGNVVIPGGLGLGDSLGATHPFELLLDLASEQQARFHNVNGDGAMRLHVGSVGGGHIAFLSNSTAAEILGIPAGDVGIVTDFSDMVFATGTGGSASERMRLGTDGVLTLLGMLVLDGGLYASYDDTAKKLLMIPADRRTRLGNYSIAIGDYIASVEGSPDSTENTIIGMNSWKGVLSSTHNVCVGSAQSGRMRAGTDYNVFIGSQTVAGINLISRHNVVIGALAANDPANIDDNVIIGSMACRDTNTVERNVILGLQAAQASTLVEDCVILGHKCADSFTAAERCIFIGSNLVGIAGSGEDLLNIGNLLTGDMAAGTALLAGVDLYKDGAGASGNLWIAGVPWSAWAGPGSGNVFLGYHDTCGLVEGDSNILLGARCGLGLSGSGGEHYDNIMIGGLVAANTNTGDGNILIGYSIECPSGHWTDALNIGDLIFGRGRTAGKTRVRIGGNVSAGLTEDCCLDIDGDDGALRLPRMSTTERNALNAVNGMIIYNYDLAKVQAYLSGTWTNL